MIYKLYKTNENKDGVIKFNDDGSMSSFILNASNPEEQAYLKWVEDGNTPLPADEGEQA
jgi:hypothetical protein